MYACDVCTCALRAGYMVTVGSSHRPAEFARPFVTSELLLLLSSAETHSLLYACHSLTEQICLDEECAHKNVFIVI